MPNLQFIIAVKNLAKCEPDYYYVCGTKLPVTSLSACISGTEVLLDGQIESALIFRGYESTAFNYGLLKALGFKGIQIHRRMISFELVATQQFENIVTQSRIESILHNIDKDDIEYLQSKGILDLTIV